MNLVLPPLVISPRKLQVISIFVVGLAGPAAAQTLAVWSGGPGDWSDATKWSSGSVPNAASADVVIDNQTSVNSIVQTTYNNPNAGIQIKLGRLRVDAGDELNFPIYKSLNLLPGAFTGAGTITNNGIIRTLTMNWGDGSSTLPVTLSGSGTLILGTATQVADVGDNAGVNGTTPFINQGKIEGSFEFGRVNSRLPIIQNSGLIESKFPGTPSQLIVSGAATNTGTIKASNGSTLLLAQGNWNNTGGLITADGAGSVIQHRANLITGGTFSTTNGGSIRLTNQPQWKDVTNLGNATMGWPVSGGAPGRLQISSSLTNSGVINVPADSSLGIGLDNGPVETVTLSGGGNIILRGPETFDPRGGIVGAFNNGNRLINQNNTISGNGTIDDLYRQWLDITNRGLIRADQPGKILGLYMKSLANEANGIVRAQDGAIIEIASSNVVNTGGTLEAVNGGIFRTGSLTRVQGGLVRNNGGTFSLNRFILINPGTGMDLQGEFTLGNGHQLTLANAINNTGDLRAAGEGSTASIIIGKDAFNAVTLSGGGTIHLGNPVTGSTATEIIENPEVNTPITLTNSANLIRGFGSIGIATQNRLVLENRSTIAADVSSKNLALSVRSLDNNGGLLQSLNGGSISLYAATGLNNTNGVVEAKANSSVAITNTRISGGTLRNNGTSFRLTGSIIDSRNSPVTLEGAITIPNGSNTTLVGNPTAIPSLGLTTTGGETRLIIGENGAPSVTLPSTGEIVLGGTASRIEGGVSGASLTNPMTLRGAGTIGISGLPALINQSQVIADVAATNLTLASTTLTNSGTIKAINGGALRFEAGTINNAGGIIRSESGSSMTFVGSGRTLTGGTVTNSSNATLVMNSNLTAKGGVTFQNSGTTEFRKSSGDTFNGLTDGGSNFINDGLMTFFGGDYYLNTRLTQRGELRWNDSALFMTGGGTASNSLYTVAANSTISFGGALGTTWNFNGANNNLTGAGRLILRDAAELHFADAASKFAVTNLTTTNTPLISGAGTLEVSSNLAFGANTRIDGAKVVQKSGATGSHAAGFNGTINLTNGAILELGGSLFLNVGTDIVGDSTSKLVVPASGTLEPRGTDESLIDSPILLQGTLKQNSNVTVKLMKGGTIDGGDIIHQQNGTQVMLTGTAPFIVKQNHNEVIGTGLVILDGGASVQLFDAQSHWINGSRFLFSGSSGTTASVSGPGRLTAAGISFVGRNALINGTTIENTGTGTQAGSLTISGSTVQFQNNARFENAGTFSFSQAPGSFVGDATTLFHNKSGGTITNDSTAELVIDMPFKNEGVLDLKRAPIRFLKSFEGRGSIRASEGANITIPAGPAGQLPVGLESVGSSTQISFTAPAGDNFINLTASNGGRLVAAGGGNLVAAGGGNLVAAGGGNLVAAGGGNLVAAGGGNILSTGGGSLVAAGGLNINGGSVRVENNGRIEITGSAGLVAAGGGNLVAAGGGNLVAAGGGNLVAAGGGNLVAAGGGNIIAAGGGNLVAAGGGNLVAAGGGNIVAAGGGNLVAAGGGNLMGTGTFSGSGFIQSGGFLKPGQSPGILTWTGNLTIENGGVLDLEIAGATAGSQYDVVNVSGALSLDGILRVSFLSDFETTIQPNQSFTVMTAGSAITGTIDNLVNGRVLTSNGYGSFAVQFANGGKSLVLTDYQTVPLSFSNWLLGKGLSGASALPTANPDGDAYNNLLEYALGLDPASANGAAITAGTVTVDSVTYLSLSFLRPVGTARPADVTYAGERGLLLATDWSSQNVVLHSVVAEGTGERVTYRSAFPINSQQKEFLRLRVAVPNP